MGVCGATIDTIQARNFARMVASGCAAHTDHGMGMLDLFREVVNGQIKDYTIKDPVKLKAVAKSIGIETEGRELKEIAMDLYKELERTYTQVEGEIPFAKRVPPKTLETWRKHGIVPRGAMREIMEMMHRTHMGVDQDYENITKQFSRTALADGWGGSMVATEISDILFGTPTPVSTEVNMGVLKEDQVNIIIHGHEPNLFESMMESVNEPTLMQAAKAAGAKGINLVGMCCSGAEMLSATESPMPETSCRRRRFWSPARWMPWAWMCSASSRGWPRWPNATARRSSPPIRAATSKGSRTSSSMTTNPRSAPMRSSSRPSPVSRTERPIEIPKIKNMGVHGFSHEYINYMLGGTFRASYTPLNDNIINGRIRGVAGVVGCTNPRVKQDWVHVELVKELIKNDVLVLQTGCSQIALAKAGLTTPEAAHLAGPGLREVCETVGMPPVLGLGSCVDNSRILIAASEMVKTGGLGDSIADLPVAGAAPEWMSEKAISIGQYFVASGVFTVFGVTFPIVEGTKFHKHLFEGLETMGLGKWGFAPDPYEMARMMIAHIDKKRKALGIDKARERTLMSMADRRSLDAAA